MSDIEQKKAIQKAINSFSNADISEKAISLFKTLGYNTNRQSPLPQKDYACFKESFLKADSKFNEAKALVKEWKTVDLLFQLTKEELSGQKNFFDTGRVDNTIIETYLFFAIELNMQEYTRSALSQITREINKVFPMPVMVIFKYANDLTLAVINRRLNKKDEQKDVLEKVTLIKDISIAQPHRAHIEILFDLSISELKRVHKFTNFVELHNAWQKTLDTKELNKRFYRELSNWYFWALQEVYFPVDDDHADKNSLLQKEERVKEHNAKNLIRLLTRILFVWFVKEKNLIPEELFEPQDVRDLIKTFEPEKGGKKTSSCYYRAVLQNLFFATLNQTVGKREFRKAGQHMNVTSLMRYESYFKDSSNYIKMLEEVVPFMNGGLFECLDSPHPTKKGKMGGDVIIYEDGFSDRDDNQLRVPDYIFFAKEIYADLSEELGDKKQKIVAVAGLINILKSYKFTITENTPIEEDIALDPELLGRVFENLLASYNPETKTTARKQTGSFYTPREIVNYMVDESLKAYLKQKLQSEAEMSPEDAEVGLDFLLGYYEREHLFDVKQTDILINAIDNCKILDPACGSGAFPMGILHKMVHILHKLDPQNKLWKERQIQKANAIDDDKVRDEAIADIETAFNNNELDYGRKLYLIENCIYGVDIQPIATQISKLRFFISLIVDQKTDKAKDNFGIRPLPNLETKFIAANTLIGIDKPTAQDEMKNAEIKSLEEKLKDVRHRLFSAKTPKTKRQLRETDKQIRQQISTALEAGGWGSDSAFKVAEWDPYDQNANADWFDPEWMFGIADGFDVVIGNPPYISAVSMARTDKEKALFSLEYPEATGAYDIYILFLLKAIEISNSTGCYSWIIPNRFLIADYSKLTKDKLLTNGLYRSVDVSNFEVFENASVYPIIIIGNKGASKEFEECLLEAYSDLELRKYKIPQVLMQYKTFEESGIKFASGATGFEASIIKEHLSCVSSERTIPFTVSGCIDRYVYSNCDVRFMKGKFERAYISNCVAKSKWYFWNQPKIVIAGMTKQIESVFVEEPLGLGVGVYAIYDWGNFNPFYLTAILNSKFMTHYINVKFKDKHLAGGYLAINKSTLECLPLVETEFQDSIATIASYLTCLYKMNSQGSAIANFWENVLDASVYELFFHKEVISINANILRWFKKLPLLNILYDETNINIIESAFKEFSLHNQVSEAIAKQKTIKEIRIIEGLD